MFNDETVGKTLDKLITLEDYYKLINKYYDIVFLPLGNRYIYKHISKNKKKINTEHYKLYIPIKNNITKKRKIVFWGYAKTLEEAIILRNKKYKEFLNENSTDFNQKKTKIIY